MHHSPEAARSPKLVIFTEQPDWHLARLLAALERRGLKPVIASLADVVFDIGGRTPIAIPGLAGRLPAAAMVRGIAAGSFEAITLRLGVLHGLEAAGVTVWNGAKAIERCVDKAATSLALLRAGLPTPRTLVTENRARALDFLAFEIGLGNQVVLKPLFGSQGKGLRLLSKVRDLPETEAVFGAFYLQRFLPAKDGRYRDMRVFVSGGQVAAAMMRVGTNWITNVHQGARPEPLSPSAEMERLAIAAANSVGAAFAGVDLIEDEDRGLMVLEVNSMPAWRGLQKVTSVDVADRMVADWLAAAGVAAAPVVVAAPAGTVGGAGQ